MLSLKNVFTNCIVKLDKTVKKKQLNGNSGLSSRAGQLLKWAPALSLFVLDAAGVKTKNNFKQHLKIIAVAEAALEGVAQPLKYATSRRRPNLSLDLRSFPSDHTANAFMGAEVFHQELKGHYPVVSYAGYVLATATGISRIYKNKHWLSDVVAGAVIGMACAKITFGIFRKMGKRQNHV